VCRNQNYRLLYCSSDPYDKNSQLAASICKGHLVDRKILYSLNSNFEKNNLLNSNSGAERYEIDPFINQLKSLVLNAGQYSRFKVDPYFTKSQYEALYKEWLYSSINRNIADDLLVLRQDVTELKRTLT
jgi:dTDP-4-amino-4,6-dideoxy-D-galactose acyltransferase